MKHAFRCECLHCDRQAVSCLTVPHHKPNTMLCSEHLEAQLTWATPYRDIPGAIVVSKVGA